MFKALLLAGCTLFLAACATHSNQMGPIRRELEQMNCDKSLAELNKIALPETDDQLLYLMEYGSALQICKLYDQSNQVLQQADKLSEQIDYVSISRVTTATLLNEQALQYKGDKFEKQFLNALSALNYLELGKAEEVMVEVRRINEKIKKMADEEKRPYELNSFASYLSGLVYETGRQYDDACISYKDSYGLDSSFKPVVLDMLTSCWRAKRKMEYNDLVKKTTATKEEIEYSKRDFKKKKREVILVFLQGWGPQKAVEPGAHSFARLIPSTSLTKKLQVTFETGNENPAAPVPLVINPALQSQIVYSVEKSAIATLEADINSLAARRLGARVAKEVVADQIRQKDKALGNLAWLVMVASERADLRNWSLLPETIQVLRLQVGEGENLLKLSGLNFYNQVSEDLGTIDLTTQPQKNIYLIRSVR
jgi:uncharacterized protein